VARSYLAGAIHNAFAGVVAVDWTLPAADPEPNLALPVLGTLTVTVV
jgi:hypothetical protein